MTSGLETRVLRIAVFDGIDIEALRDNTTGLPENTEVEYTVINERYKRDRQDDLADLMKDFDGAFFRSDTCFYEALQELEHLEVMGRAGIQIDKEKVDLQAVTKQGIVMYFSPDSNSNAVSEGVFGQIEEYERGLGRLAQRWMDGESQSVLRKVPKGRDRAYKTLAIAGVGDIGSKVAVKALAYKMNIKLYDPGFSNEELVQQLEKEMGDGLQLKDRQKILDGTHPAIIIVHNPEDLAKGADYVTFHIPDNDSNRGVVDKKFMEAMENHAALINDSRAAIVDHEALMWALETKEIAGYISDVEGDNSPLTSLDNVLLTPHILASTRDAKRKAAGMLAESVSVYLESNGKTLLRSYNAPSIHPDLEDAYSLIRIMAAFGTKYVRAIGEEVESIKVLASGLRHYDKITPRVLEMAAAAGSLHERMNGTDVPATALLKEEGIEVSGERTERAMRGKGSRITLIYETKSGNSLEFTGYVDDDEEVPKHGRNTIKDIDGYVSKGTSLHPTQYLLIGNEDNPGVLVNIAKTFAKDEEDNYRGFNIEVDPINPTNPDTGERMLVFSLRRKLPNGEYDPENPTIFDEIIDEVRQKTTEGAPVVYVDLRKY
jgi:D-3-phosphoglycerate dehydrogenase / 2-oxoglutarate reductase